MKYDIEQILAMVKKDALKQADHIQKNFPGDNYIDKTMRNYYCYQVKNEGRKNG